MIDILLVIALVFGWYFIYRIALEKPVDIKNHSFDRAVIATVLMIAQALYTLVICYIYWWLR